MNKTVLITGASSGIGAGCAYKFASQGARLILNARSTDKLESLAQELKDKYNAACFVMPFDVCNRNAASAALEALPDEWKSIDILINNAGLAIGTDKEHEGYEIPYLFVVLENKQNEESLICALNNYIKTMPIEEQPKKIFVIDKKPISHFKTDRKFLQKEYDLL